MVGAFLRRTFRSRPRTGCCWPAPSKSEGDAAITLNGELFSVSKTGGMGRATEGSGWVAARGGSSDRALRVDGILEGFDDTAEWLDSVLDKEGPLLVIFVGAAMRGVDDSRMEELESLADAFVTGNDTFRDWEAGSFNRGIRPPSNLCDAMVLPDSNLQLQSKD